MGTRRIGVLLGTTTDADGGVMINLVDDLLEVNSSFDYRPSAIRSIGLTRASPRRTPQ
jgi:hypothetical protein